MGQRLSTLQDSILNISSDSYTNREKARGKKRQSKMQREGEKSEKQEGEEEKLLDGHDSLTCLFGS